MFKLSLQLSCPAKLLNTIHSEFHEKSKEILMFTSLRNQVGGLIHVTFLLLASTLAPK